MSSYIEGQVNQLMNKLEAEGFTAEDLTKLGQYKKLSDFLGVLRKTHEIKSVERCWQTTEDGTICFQLTGLGLTSPQWISRLESKGHKLSKWAKDVLNSPDFASCEKSKVYEIVVLPGKLFSDEERTTRNIRAEGDRRNLKHGKDLPTEIGCLIRENFTNEEIEQMGLSWLVTMHHPVEDSDGDPSLLSTGRHDGGSWLSASWGYPGYQWDREDGFVFVASQD